MISRVEIANFKAIRNASFDVVDVNVLVGANNSGKSSAIQAMHFALSAVQSAELQGTTSWRRNRSTTLGPHQLLWSPIEDTYSLAHGFSLSQDVPIRVTFAQDATPTTISLARGKNRNITVAIDRGPLAESIMSLESTFSVYVPGLAGIAKNERFLTPGVVRRMVAQGDANLAFRNVLLQLHNDVEAWQKFLTSLRSVFRDYTIRVSHDMDTDEFVQVSLVDPHDIERPIDTAGTGILQAIQVFAYSTLFRPHLLLLDEPDSHLHPNNQIVLARVLRHVAERENLQVICCTHSRHVMESLGTEGRVIWFQGGSVMEERDATAISILADLGALNITESLMSGDKSCLVLTEDSELLALRALLEASGFRVEETEVQSYAGCSKLDAALVATAVLSRLLPNVRVIIHRDRDGMTDAESARYKAELSRHGISCFITHGNDVEAYFLSAEHVRHSAPELSAAEAQAIIDEAEQEVLQESTSRLIDIRSQLNYRRPVGERQPPGALALECQQLIANEPQKYLLSKKILNLVAAKVQARIGRNTRLRCVSPHLIEPELRQLALDLWPAL